jgi:outer membrane protein
MKKIILSTALIFGFANADFIGAEVGIASWDSSINGNFKYNGTNIGTKDNLGMDNQTNAYIWASFEHPVPIIPNIKIKHTKQEYNANKTLTENITFGDKTFVSGSMTKSNINLNQTDLIAYYEILDNYVSIDLGLNLKIINAKFELNNEDVNKIKDFTLPLPMVYSKAKVELPLTGLFAQAELSFLNIGDSKFYDAQTSLGYETSIGFGAKIGYRKENLELSEVKDTSANLIFDGAFASFYYHF